jgi:hypothetical protein
LAASSIALQLGHLTGLARPGFAWRTDGSQAEVWYWDEAAAGTPALKPGTLPCPEMLLRAGLSDGLHLVRCLEGFEAISVAQGRAQRTRWFAGLPEALSWQAFVQDAGADPAAHPVPDAQTMNLGDLPGRAWSIQTSMLSPLSNASWAILAAVTLVGAAFFALLSYQLKLSQRVDALQQEHAAVAKESGVALRLQQQIESQRQQLGVVAAVQPKVLQLKVMARMADAGVFDEDTKVSLQEWEYRNHRIRLQFAVPAEGFVLSEFLESIEKLGLFSEVRLLPGTPPQTVGLQAVLVGDDARLVKGGVAP